MRWKISLSSTDIFVIIVLLLLIGLIVLIAVFNKKTVSNPFFVGQSPNGQGDSSFELIPECTLYNFPMPLQEILVKNFSQSVIQFQIGHGPIGNSYQAAIQSSISPNETQTYLPPESVESMYFHVNECP